MPRIFNVDKWVVFFWSGEGVSLEPIHVHVSLKTPQIEATKIWLTSSGGCLLANNDSNIPMPILRSLMEIIETRKFEIMAKWKEHFGSITYYC